MQWLGLLGKGWVDLDLSNRGVEPGGWVLYTPKWMVKIMENPKTRFFNWDDLGGKHPYFWKHLYEQMENMY